MPKTPTVYTAFRCPADLIEKAKRKARDQRRSLSNYLITLIERAVEENLPQTPRVSRKRASG